MKFNAIAWLVLIASLTGFFFTEIQSESGARSIASVKDQEVHMTEFALMGTVEKAQSQVSKMNPNPTVDMTCSCKIGDDVNELKYETNESCTPDRTYFNADLAKLKKIDKMGAYTVPRNTAAAEAILPKKCTLYIQKTFFKDRAFTAAVKLQNDIDFNAKIAEMPEGTALKEIKDIKEYKDDQWVYAKCPEPKFNKDAAGNIKVSEVKDGGGETVKFQDVEWTPERIPNKACMTEDYVTMVHNSLLDASECLGVPAKFMAPKLANESGLHANILAKGLDGGVGQFTGPAMTDIMTFYDKFLPTVDMKKPACARLNSIPGAIPKSAQEIFPLDKQRCSMIATPPNPMRSLFLYGVFYHQVKKDSLKAWNRTSDDPNFKSVEKLMDEAGISKFDKAKIQQYLFVMAYNSGPGQPVLFFKEWLRYRMTTLKKFPITVKDFDMTFWPERAISKLDKGEGRAKALLATRSKAEKDKPLSMGEYFFAYRDSLYIPGVKGQATRLDKALGQGTCTEDKFLEM